MSVDNEELKRKIAHHVGEIRRLAGVDAAVDPETEETPERVAELDAAMVNREAQFAIGVFRTRECAPTSVPFHCVGENKAIVVLDNDSDLALRLAYQWARMTVRAGLAAESGDEIDIDR